jgi:hypothetical protein
MKWLINYKDGIFEGVDPDCMKRLTTELTSYRGHQIFLVNGKHVSKTQTCFSWGGTFVLVNSSREALEADYSLCVGLQMNRS